MVRDPQHRQTAAAPPPGDIAVTAGAGDDSAIRWPGKTAAGRGDLPERLGKLDAMIERATEILIQFPPRQVSANPRHRAQAAAQPVRLGRGPAGMLPPIALCPHRRPQGAPAPAGPKTGRAAGQCRAGSGAGGRNRAEDRLCARRPRGAAVFICNVGSSGSHRLQGLPPQTPGYLRCGEICFPEDLLNDTAGTIAQILTCMKAPVPHETVEAIAKRFSETSAARRAAVHDKTITPPAPKLVALAGNQLNDVRGMFGYSQCRAVTR